MKQNQFNEDTNPTTETDGSPRPALAHRPLTDEEVVLLLEEVEGLDKGAVGEFRLSLRQLRVSLDAIYAEGYIVEEWHEHRGADNLCGKKRASAALEILGDCLNELPHGIEAIRKAARDYAEAEGWEVPKTLNPPERDAETRT